MTLNLTTLRFGRNQPRPTFASKNTPQVNFSANVDTVQFGAKDKGPNKLVKEDKSEDMLK